MDDSTTSKRCSKCGIPKPATTDYYHRYKRSKDGLKPYCKECAGKAEHDRYHNNPDVRDRAIASANAQRLDPEYQEKHRQIYHRNCAADPTYKARRNERSRERIRERRETEPGFAEHERQRQRKWEAENHERHTERKRAYFSRPDVKERLKIKARIRRADPEKHERMLENERRSYRNLRSDPAYVERKREVNRIWRRKRYQTPEGRAIVLAHNYKRKARKRNAVGTFTADDVLIQYRSQRGKCWHCGKPVGDDYHIDHLIPLARGGTNDARNIVISCPFCNMSRGAKLPQEWNGRLF